VAELVVVALLLVALLGLAVQVAVQMDCMEVLAIILLQLRLARQILEAVEVAAVGFLHLGKPAQEDQA
jgi:hypothetical protein